MEIVKGVVALLKDKLSSPPDSYDSIGRSFLREANGGWFINAEMLDDTKTARAPATLEPYRINFQPLRVDISGMSQPQVRNAVTVGIFEVIKQALPPSKEAYTYTIIDPVTKQKKEIKYYIAKINREGGSLADWSREGQLGRYSVGLVRDDLSQVDLVVFPPGYDHVKGYMEERSQGEALMGQLKSEKDFPGVAEGSGFTEIKVEDIASNLPQDPNPNRGFRKRLTAEGSYWEAGK